MIFLVFLVLTILFAVLLTGGMVFMVNSMGKSVHRLHIQLEHVMNTNAPPPDWTRAIERKIARAAEIGKSEKRIRHLSNNGKKRVLKKLNHLIAYFKSSPVFENEHARTLLLNELREIRNRWKSGEWQSILAGHCSEGATHISLK